MLRYLLLCLCLFFVLTKAAAQGENNIWTFGHHNGLDFNNNPPTFFQSSIISVEGCASVSDAAGNLLFYSNGNDVWNATGTVMPNGGGILGNGPAMGGIVPGSSAQGVAIVKSLGNNNRYYLFTLDAGEQINQVYPGYLRYSVIDMSLNGGTGDVVAGQKNIMLDTGMTEKMTVTKGAGCYYWLLTHRNNTTAYRAFKIDASGIHPGITSDGVEIGNISGGHLKVSHDGTKIVAVNTVAGAGIEMASFDKATGMVSNAVIFDPVTFQSRLGACFSPDNSKLYISSFGDIVQYDLSAFPNMTAVTATKVMLDNGAMFCDIRNGPDGKIYVAPYQLPFIGVISDPNNAGLACNLNTQALPRPTWSAFPNVFGNPFGYGLGNDIVTGIGSDTTINNTRDTLICFGDAVTVSAPAGANSYLWEDGSSNPERTLTANGTYWVYSYHSCNTEIDTFKVMFAGIGLDLGRDTAICNNSTLLLDAGQEGASYQWQDGSTLPTFLVTGKGTYTVKLSIGNCRATDTIRIDTFQPYVDIAEGDTLVCNDKTLILHAIANPLSSYQWNNGSTTANIPANTAGSYTVTATNACGTFTDSVRITIQNCDCRSFIPTAFSPNGDRVNDEFKAEINCRPDNFNMSIFNRYGQRLFQSSSPDKGWDGTFDGNAIDMGTYFYYIRFKGPDGNDFELKGDISLLR